MKRRSFLAILLGLPAAIKAGSAAPADPPVVFRNDEYLEWKVIPSHPSEPIVSSGWWNWRAYKAGEEIRAGELVVFDGNAVRPASRRI